jgi:hypothetical protein
MTPELKPCPFCGSTKLTIDYKSTSVGHNGLGQRVERHTYSVRCNVCHARGGTVGGKVVSHYRFLKEKLPEWETTDDVLRNKAILTWNNRKDGD